VYHELQVVLDVLVVRQNNDYPPQGRGEAIHILNRYNLQWLRPELLSSRQIRLLLYEERLIHETKLLMLTEEGAMRLYGKIAKLRSVPSRSKILRLLHGDVYCKERLFRFRLADDNLCGHCFGIETIRHLLIECPYSVEVWGRLGVMPTEIAGVVNEDLSLSELEIRAELINMLVFRKKVLPPEVLIRSVLTQFQKGLSERAKTREYAKLRVETYEITGQWFD
jgi:hypothetical protein